MMKPKATTATTAASTPIRLSFHPGRPALRRGKPTEFDLLVQVHTPELPAARDGQESSRPPLNLALVLDRSGSMGGQKMEYARQAARAFSP